MFVAEMDKKFTLSGIQGKKGFSRPRRTPNVWELRSNYLLLLLCAEKSSENLTLPAEMRKMIWDTLLKSVTVMHSSNSDFQCKKVAGLLHGICVSFHPAGCLRLYDWDAVVIVSHFHMGKLCGTKSIYKVANSRLSISGKVFEPGSYLHSREKDSKGQARYCYPNIFLYK